MTIANAFSELGVNDAAKPHYLKALELRRGLAPPDPGALAETQEKLGRLYRREGNLDEAERMLDAALRLRRETTHDPFDGYFAVNLNSLGILKRNQRKYEEAEVLLVESLIIYCGSLGPEDESVPVVLHNLASIYLDSGRTAQAEPLLYEAHALALKLHGQLHADVALIETALATACRANGNSLAAERFALQALATYRLVYGDLHPRVAAAQLRLAEVLMAQKELAGAEEMYCEAVAGFRAVQLPQDLARALPAYARLLNARGKHREAAECCSEALAIPNLASYLPAEEIANIRALQATMHNMTVIAAQPSIGGSTSTP
jgi:tetratricopeptide (TPR) repeat protein